MSLSHIISTDYGQIIELTMIDVDTDLAADVSSYTTTKQMIFTTPTGVDLPVTATYKDDGSDGILQWTVTEDFFSAGVWRVRGRVAAGTAILSTVKHRFTIKD